jgi:tRNA(fMet)-specific endonuclease VapC
MLILDTDLPTLVQRKSGEAYKRLNDRLEAASSDQVIGVTIVRLEEQMRGWLAWIAKAKSMERLVEAYLRLRGLLDDFGTRTVLDFDEQAATIYRRLIQSRIRVGAMDLRIAAVARARNATLLSRNLKDFRRVPDLHVEDWTA